ncbi:MAG: orotate phosphoribosyltransferase [Rhizobiales bacterium]|nr:orotate phosphoribosyltransferase [Hyphomicrobiales bacterium]
MESRRSSSDTLSIRTRAFNIIKSKSFSRGKFVLASGRESNFYLDMKPSMFDSEGANLLSELILERIASLEADFVGGLEMGAVPIVSSVAMLSFTKGMRPLTGFFVRKEVKGHGTKKKIEAVHNLQGKKVIVLEDVTTTGGSAMQAVTAVRDAGGEVLLVLSLVDREEGAAEFYKQQSIPFASLFRVSEFLATS